jgi:hypothetical protein
MEPSANEDTSVGCSAASWRMEMVREYIFGCMKVVDGEALYESSSFKDVFLTKHVAPGQSL